jgi:Cu/Ag efflux protein CusF
LVGCAKDDKQAAAAGPKPSDFQEQKQTVTATVEAVDSKTRMVTLRGEDGGAVRFKAGEDVRNLEQVKVGDRVAVDYYESVAIKVQPPGEAVNEVRTADDRAEPGEKPGGMVAQHTTMTAIVEKLDKKNSMVTLRGPKGNLHTITARDPKNLQNVNVGDRVLMTYTEMLAVDVRPAPPSP